MSMHEQSDVSGCVNYMMHFAMTESRILSFDRRNDDVIWHYDDHKTEERSLVREKGISLPQKIIMHSPNENFVTVKYYGLYNNRSVLGTCSEWTPSL